MVPPHPWVVLAALRHVRLAWTPMGDRTGCTDGHSTIWLDPRQLQVQRRCSLAHELVHLHHRHEGCQPRRVEVSVEHTAARWLLPELREVADALAWSSGHLGEAAEQLWVDEPTLAARLAGLSARETKWMGMRLA